MHFVLYGHGTLIANGEKISLSKGDVFLLFTDEKYEYYPDPIRGRIYGWTFTRPTRKRWRRGAG